MNIFDGAASITTQNLNPLTGVPTPGSFAVLDISKDGADTASIQVVGTYTGALSVQVSNNGITWVTMAGTPLVSVATGVGSATIPSATQGIYQVEVAGFRFVRVSALVAVTGTAVVTLVASDTNGLVGLDMPLPAGTANIGTVNAIQVVNSAPGSTPVSVNSAATTNAAVSKATAGVVLNVSANNTTVVAKYIRFYNKATAPTVGTDVPILVVTVPASSSKEIEFGTFGKRFSNGIGLAITNAAPVLDATVVAAGDVQLAYDYI